MDGYRLDFELSLSDVRMSLRETYGHSLTFKEKLGTAGSMITVAIITTMYAQPLGGKHLGLLDRRQSPLVFSL
jgi:hypothetical protein